MTTGEKEEELMDLFSSAPRGYWLKRDSIGGQNLSNDVKTLLQEPALETKRQPSMTQAILLSKFVYCNKCGKLPTFI